jgi:hypothetical protein
MTALFTACSNEDDNLKNENEGQKVTFVIGGVDSRTMTAGDFTTTFVTGDAIGIYGTNVTPAMSNVQYNVTANGASATIAPEEEDATFAYGDQTAVFNAYYPYTEGFTNTFSVLTDQSTVIATSDFLTATATGSKEKATVELNFEHRLALVQVKLTGVTDVQSVTLKNAQTNVTFTNSTDGKNQGTVSLVTGENKKVSDIIMNPKPTNTYWAIIPAQSIEAGSLFVVTTENGTYIYKKETTTIFSEGTVAKYSLTLKSDEPEENPTLVDYSTVQVRSWTTENEEITGDLEEQEREKFSFTNLFPEAKPTSTSYVGQTSETPVWLYGNLQNITINTTATINNVENTPVITFESPKSTITLSWSNCGLAYFGGTSTKLVTSSSYTLKFWAKVEKQTGWNDATPSLNIFIFDKVTLGTNMFYGISAGEKTNAGQINIEPTDTWTEYTFTVDLSKYTANVANNATTPNGSTQAAFSICFNTLVKSQVVSEADVPVTYSIANISFEEN